MSRFVSKFVIGFAVCLIGPQLLCAQDNADGSAVLRSDRPLRLIQTAAEIAALPASSGQGTAQAQASKWNDDARPSGTIGVRAGFAPAPQSGSNAGSNSGYRSSFYNQNATAAQGDVYPYPASGQPRIGVGSKSAYALSQGSGNGRLADQISIGSNTSTGNLGDSRNIAAERYAANQQFWTNQRTTQAVRNQQAAANGRAPVEQQRSSTLSAAQQATVNQAAVERLRAQQYAAQYQTEIERLRALQAQQTAAQNQVRVARANTQANTQPQDTSPNFRASQAANQQATAYRQAANQQAAAYQQAAYRQAAYQAQNRPVRVAQNCCQPNYNPLPTTAGYQAAFQRPSINPNVGAGLGLGVPPLNIQTGQVGQFGQGALGQQGFQQPNYGGYGGYQLNGNLGTPQFGAQGARWWTPFFSGSGNYPPLVNLVRNNAGTYLGQGIVGQPTAYVNGQLVRNLFRYLAP